MQLDNSKVLVIGGAGFIGGFVVTELLKTKVKEVIIYDNFARGKLENIENSLKDPRCKVLKQVTNGVAIRAAVLKKLILR